MRFAFIARHRNIWPVAWLCDALDVSRSGFHAWLNRSPSARSRHDEILVAKIGRSFKSSDRTYGARRVWHDVLAEGLSCGLHRIERLMRENGLRARPRRRRLPKDTGEHQERPQRADCISALQKAIRRGLEREAMEFAVELMHTSKAFPQHGLQASPQDPDELMPSVRWPGERWTAHPNSVLSFPLSSERDIAF